ncbi:MAG TPA: GNAT family N-acetyltransferase [Gemmatimonadaceae bacterium]|nr:GNAT family N-acetyltransferase [Gemmatimonadaceae bacterium]
MPATTRDAWRALAAASGDAGIFVGPGWFDAWWPSFGTPGTLAIVELARRGETVGVFPCAVARAGPSRLLCSLTNEHSFYFDFALAPAGREETIARFCGLLASRAPRAAVRFDAFSRRSPTVSLLASLLRRRGFPVHQASVAWAPWIDVRGPWADFETALHSKLRNNLKKGRRRAEREGTLAFEVVRSGDALQPALTEAFAVEHSSWKGGEGTSIQSDATVERFYRRLAEWAASEGRFSLFALRLNGRMIAFDYCLASGRTMFALKTGYEQSLAARFSPGNLMRHELLRTLFADERFDRYDFLGPAYPWKLEWNARAEAKAALTVYPRDVAGWWEYGSLYGWKTALKRALRLSGHRRWKYD